MGGFSKSKKSALENPLTCLLSNKKTCQFLSLKRVIVHILLIHNAHLSEF